MSSPITPAVTITTVSDETTVVEQPREESPFPQHIPPPQSMYVFAVYFYVHCHPLFSNDPFWQRVHAASW